MNDELPPAKKLQQLLTQQYAEDASRAGGAPAAQGHWDTEDLAIVYLAGAETPVTATVTALTEAEVDGNKLVHYAADVPQAGLGLGLLRAVAESQMGASVDLSPLTGQFQFLDDWGALTTGLAQEIAGQVAADSLAGAATLDVDAPELTVTEAATSETEPETETEAEPETETEAQSQPGALRQVLLAAHTNALRAVAAAAEAEGVTWSRIGTTGGEILVITGDGIAPHPEHTLLVFDPAEYAAK